MRTNQSSAMLTMKKATTMQRRRRCSRTIRLPILRDTCGHGEWFYQDLGVWTNTRLQSCTAMLNSPATGAFGILQPHDQVAHPSQHADKLRV